MVLTCLINNNSILTKKRSPIKSFTPFKSQCRNILQYILKKKITLSVNYVTVINLCIDTLVILKKNDIILISEIAYFNFGIIKNLDRFKTVITKMQRLATERVTLMNFTAGGNLNRTIEPLIYAASLLVSS